MSNISHIAVKNKLQAVWDAISSIRLAFWLSGLLYAGGLVYLAYFPSRTDTCPLMLGFAALFGLYLWSYHQGSDQKIYHWMALALLLRLLLLPAIPSLSNDFYRFIWDGRLLAAGENPFAQLPSWYMQAGAPAIAGINQGLYENLNSPHYFSIYPPITQGIFTLAAWLSPGSIRGSVMIMRLFILLAETGTIFLLYRLLKTYRKPPQLLLLYALNPLIILELTGNLHFEALMIFFLLLTLLLFGKYQQTKKRKWLGGTAMAMAAAIATKLLPLMFLPLWLRRLPRKKLLYFYEYCALATAIFFLLLLSPALSKGFARSIALYYHKFEFNAGLYYLIREIGYWMTGNNIIWQAGPILALLTIIGIFYLSLHKRLSRLQLAEGMFWAYSIFLLFSLTLHPWYITPLLALSILTPYRFPALWSGLIFLTYASYGPEGVRENYWVITLEYGAVLAFLLWEIRKKQQNHPIHQTTEENKSFA
jgi:alpha-1,6-mannosyltransferase